MSLERPSSARPNANGAESSESMEKAVQSRLFKGLLAVGAGALGTAWDSYSHGERFLGIKTNPRSPEEQKKYDERGFFGDIAERTKKVFETLDNAERIVDPNGRVTLYDVFNKFMELSGQPEREEKAPEEKIK